MLTAEEEDILVKKVEILKLEAKLNKLHEEHNSAVMLAEENLYPKRLVLKKILEK